MIYRRRGYGKYLIFICAVWLIYAFIFDARDDSGNFEINQDLIDKLVERANKHAKLQASAIEHENLKEIKKEPIHLADDHDHPIEEIKKAEEQVKQLAGNIQVNAPVVHDLGSVPGELGKAVIIDKDKLSPEEQKKFDKGWEDNAFNQYVSDMISVHRSLADFRDNECKIKKWFSPLPTVSVIIIFHNEAWSVLLRTIHSVIDRSDPKLLQEVLVIDDFSDFPHLGKPLQDYIDDLKKVTLVRANQREGLIRARLLGSSRAKGDVLIFLDSHCECADGWLEPLIDPIARNSNVSTVPLIESIDDNTFAMHGTPIESTQVGGFDWNLIYHWHMVPKREMDRRQSRIDPIRSPTMAGGLFAISRKYFELLGSYDPGMDVWGGENMEISFKIWMCGGELVCAPCSHVGHIFRKRSPYKWPGGNPVKKNTIRVAEVWLDEFKENYYERIHHNLGEYGDVSERKKLRENLHCKSFSWYLKNIYPEQFVPSESKRAGEIRSKASPSCIDASNEMNKPIGGYSCHGLGGNQYFLLSNHGEIRRDDLCFDYAYGETGLRKLDLVFFSKCHGYQGNQNWWMDNDGLIHHDTGACLEITEDHHKLYMAECDSKILRQQFIWEIFDRKKSTHSNNI